MNRDYFSVEVKFKQYKHIELETLYEILKTSVSRTKIVRIDSKKAVGYVLAKPIHAIYDRPPLDISHVDGFAVRSSDLVNASRKNPVKLRLVKNIDPRRAGDYVLSRGETVFVETGHPIPVGADAVIPVEDTIVNDEYVYFHYSIKPGFHVFPGETDLRRGDLVFDKGVRITPLVIKILLDLGYNEVYVYNKPRIAIYSIGDEIIDQPYDPEIDKLPGSTRYLDKYSIKYYGGIIVDEDILPDNPEKIMNRIKNILHRTDLVVTIGGVSMGPKDKTWITLYRGFKPEKYWRGVKIWPGRSNSGLIVNGKPIINQPGLHQSSLTTLILIITPILNYMQGLELKPKYPCIEAELEEDIVMEKYIDHYRIWYLKLEGNRVKPIENKGSYYLSPMTKSNSYTILKPGVTKINRNTKINTCFYPPIHSYEKPIV